MAFRKGSCEATGLLKTLSTTDIPIICEISCIASSVKSALGSKWIDFSLQNGDVLPRFCVPPTHSVSAHFTFCFGLEHQKTHFKDIRSCFQQLLVKLFTHFPSPLMFCEIRHEFFPIVTVLLLRNLFLNVPLITISC